MFDMSHPWILLFNPPLPSTCITTWSSIRSGASETYGQKRPERLGCRDSVWGVSHYCGGDEKNDEGMTTVNAGPAQSPLSLPVIHLAHLEPSSPFWNFCDTGFPIAVHLRDGRRFFSADTLVVTLFTSLARWLHILIANGDLGPSANSARPSGCIWRGKRPR